MMNGKRMCVSLTLLGALLIGTPKAGAQGGQEPSVADAARRAREQKAASAKPTTVITNDTLKPASPASPEVLAKPESVVGIDAAAASSPAVATVPQGEAAKAPPAAKGPTDQEAAEKKARIAALKQQVADKKKEVDLQKRELALANDSYYSRPDFSNDPDGKAKLDAMQSVLKQKQDEFDELKAKLAAEGPEAAEKPVEAGKPETTKPEATTPEAAKPE